MTRRRWLLFAVGAAAGAAGLAWRHGQEDSASAALPALWQARFDRPEGGELVMASLLGRPLVLNFWGSWCPPCVKEMPELDQLQRQWSKGRVVGLAVDNPGAVREFLAKRPVSYTIGLAGFDGASLSRELGNTQGSLPFTVLFDRRGRIVQRKLGTVSLPELQAWTRDL
jgi:thiol-disulfide isomerase/thioredoxin